MANIAYGLGSEWDYVGNLRRADALRQLQQSQRALDRPNLLDSAAQQLCKLSLILRRDVDAQRWTTHTSEYAPKQFYMKMAFNHFFKRSKTP